MKIIKANILKILLIFLVCLSVTYIFLYYRLDAQLAAPINVTTQVSSDFQSCGTMDSGHLPETEYGYSTNRDALYVEKCFYNAFISCQLSTLSLGTHGVDTGYGETYYITKNQKGKCNITATTNNFVNVKSSTTQTVCNNAKWVGNLQIEGCANGTIIDLPTPNPIVNCLPAGLSFDEPVVSAGIYNLLDQLETLKATCQKGTNGTFLEDGTGKFISFYYLPSGCTSNPSDDQNKSVMAAIAKLPNTNIVICPSVAYLGNY